MNKRSALPIAIASITALTVTAQSPSVADMNTRLRAEETNNSKAMWIMHEITDVHGPRLTGSPGLREAQDWAVATMKSWGLDNVKLEPWNFNHQGWQNYETSANVLKPFQAPLSVRAVSWTPGTKGVVEGPVLVVVPPNPPAGGGRGGAGGGRGGGGAATDTAAIAQAGTSPPPMPAPPAASTKPVMQSDLDAYLASIKPKVKGSIVFYGPHVEVPENFVPAPLRRPDDQWAGGGGRGGARGGQPPAANFVTGGTGATGAAGANAGGGGRRGGGTGGGGANAQSDGLSAQQIATQVNKFLIDNGALVKVTDSGRAYGIILQQASSGYNENPDSPNLPSLVMGNEDYGRIYRTATIDNLPITVRVNIKNEFYPEGKTVYNVTGEIRGTDKADEVVMVGGHFDSWNAATGATDNGAGSTDALEAIRLLKAVGAKMHRTVRVALWSGEEEGLYGSIAYVGQHFGSAENPKPEWFKLVAYLNIDTGTGKPRAASVFGPPEAAKMLQEPLSLFKDWGFNNVSASLGRNTGGTDSTSFNNAGLPGVGLSQDPYDYNSYTHHTSFDTYERIYEPDMREAAVEEALALYALANADQMLPRCSAATMPPPPPKPAPRAGGPGPNVPVTPVVQFYGPPLAEGQPAPAAPSACTASTPAGSATGKGGMK